MKRIFLILISFVVVTVALATMNFNKKQEANTKPEYIVYTAIWCPHCREEYKELQKVYDKVDMKVYISNVRTTETEAINFIKENNYTFPYVYDRTGEVAKELKVEYIPATYKLQEDGTYKLLEDVNISEENINDFMKK